MARLFFLFAALLLPAPLAAQPSLEQQLEQWLEWFPGRYDSHAQTEVQAAEGVPASERNYRRSSIFRRVDLPAFGPIVFYAEQRHWRPYSPFEGEVYRQRIYAISLDEERQAIRLRVHVPRDQAALLGAYADPELLSDLTPDDTVVWPGCDVFWLWEDEHYIGRLDPGACRFNSPGYGQEVQLEEYLLLAEDEMHFADRGLTMDGDFLFGMRGETPTIAARVRAFSCSVRDNARLGNREEVWAHDQGGLILLDARREDGSPPMRMRLAVSEVGENDRLKLELLAAGYSAAPPLATATAPAEAQSIGLTIGGIAVQCRHAPDRVFDAG